MRIQAKRRPPSRQHVHETTNTAETFEDNTALSQAASSTVENGQLADLTVDSPLSLSTRVPVTHQLDVAQSSIVDAINSQPRADDSAAAAVLSTQSVSTVTTSANNVTPGDTNNITPGDTLSPGSKTQVLKPSSDVDDIFADSSLFVTCKHVSCLYFSTLYCICHTLENFLQSFVMTISSFSFTTVTQSFCAM